jgi:hypothetical protein
MYDYRTPLGMAGGAVGAAGGQAGGNFLSRLLGGVTDAIDAPRQALTNLGRTGMRALSGEAGMDDVMSAIPGALGAGATGALLASGAGAPLGILTGALMGGAAQLGGKSYDEGRTDAEGNALGNRFDAASTDDIAKGIGFDPEDLMGKAASFGIGMATDPLSYTGGALGQLLGKGAGTKLGEGIMGRAFEKQMAPKLAATEANPLGKALSEPFQWAKDAGSSPWPVADMGAIAADDARQLLPNGGGKAPQWLLDAANAPALPNELAGAKEKVPGVSELLAKLRQPEEAQWNFAGGSRAPTVPSPVPVNPASDLPTRQLSQQPMMGGSRQLEGGTRNLGPVLDLQSSIRQPADDAELRFIRGMFAPDNGEPLSSMRLEIPPGMEIPPGRETYFGRNERTVFPQISTNSSPLAQRLGIEVAGNNGLRGIFSDALQETGGRMTRTGPMPEMLAAMQKTDLDNPEVIGELERLIRQEQRGIPLDIEDVAPASYSLTTGGSMDERMGRMMDLLDMYKNPQKSFWRGVAD